MKALAVHKSDLSNMLSVVAKIPVELIDLIGPAHGIGRRNWIELSEYLAVEEQINDARQILISDQTKQMKSTDRFKHLLSCLKPQIENKQVDVWTSSNGQKLAKVMFDSDKLSVVINRKISPEFANFVLEKLPELYEKYEKENKRSK